MPSRRMRALALLVLLALAGMSGCRPESRSASEAATAAAWKRRFRGEIVAVSLSGDGGLLLVATTPDARGRGDDRVTAIDATGAIVWQQILERKAVGISLTNDGSIALAYLGDGRLRAWNADGDLLWEIPCAGVPSASATGDLIACHGAGEETANDEAIQAFDSRGRPRWVFRDATGVWDLEISDAGDAAVGVTQAGRLVALDSRGRLRWSRDLGPVLGTVGISPGDGAVTVVGTGIQGERLGAFDRDGKPLWSASVPGGVETLDVSRDGAFVAAASNTTSGQRVSLFDGNGKLSWTFQLDQPAREPVRVRISESGDRVYAAMERDGNPVITGWDLHGEIASRIVLPSDVIDFDVSRDGGRLVAVAREGKLLYYALRHD